MGEGALATTVVQAEFVHTENIEENEIITLGSLRVDAHLPRLVAELHAEAERLESNSGEVTIAPDLRSR